MGRIFLISSTPCSGQLWEFFTDFALEFAIIVALELGEVTLAENFVASAASEVFEGLNARMPSGRVMMKTDGVFGAFVLAGHVMLWAEVFAREDGELAGFRLISSSFAIESEWPEVFGVDRWTVDGF